MASQPLLDFDPLYLGLAATAQERREKYRSFVSGTIAEEETERIRRAVQRGQLTGNEQFVEEIEAQIGKRIEFRGQGRPKKKID